MSVYYIKDLQDGISLPLTADQLFSNKISLLLSLIGMAADSLAIYALVKQGNIPQDRFWQI